MNKWMLMCLAVVTASSCATLQVKKDKITATKKLAIVGYSGVLDLDDAKQKGGLAGTIGAIKGSADLMSGKLDARRVEQAAAGYAELAQRLSKNFGVAVSDRSELASSPTYAQAIQKSPSSGLMVVGLQHLPEVLRAEVAAMMKPEAKQALASELGVDAIATVSIRYEVGNTSGFAVAGLGKTTIYPRAVLDFTVYDATGQAVWRDFYARGETTSEGLANTMGADIVANETEVLNAALASGYDALLKRYQEAQ
jgi:hypothetical protein